MAATSFFNTAISQIHLLTTDNWFTWKTEMEMLLAMEGLDEIVNGTEKKEGDAKATWDQKDKKAKGIIFFRIDPQYRSFFASPTSSANLWEALKTKFEASNLATRIVLKCDSVT